LKVGSNASDFIQDSPIQKDWNGLPMILGTSIAGVLRKDFNQNLVDDIFGKDEGSKIIFSNALLLDENNQVCEKLLLKKSKFLQIFDTLPIREHTAINAQGVAKEHSKFDEEVLYKGTRFKLSMEMIDDNEESFNEIINLLSSASFRLGGGSTKGFGKCKIVSIETKKYDNDSYGEYSSSLNSSETMTSDSSNGGAEAPLPIEKYTQYNLEITPDDFFMFGSGFGDADADMTPVYEQIVDYENANLSDAMILIPASSIKGAIAHRTTYHYNLENKLFIGNSEAKESIKEIFGEAKNSKKDIDGSKGKVIFSDCYKTQANTKVFDHVSIDRFTGGAIEGALFQEKTIADDRAYNIEILVEKDSSEEYQKYIKAFEMALKDITTGLLSLGGATTKGHGIFSGKVTKDGEQI
ncbi:MAG: hypothetical protein JJV88_01835, partial [Sulfurovum sp.]|nr:hypothetical protein [Sulfurovaceae bacterium]